MNLYKNINYTMPCNKNNNSDDLCIFCLELLNNKNTDNELQDMTYANLKLNCNHIFHFECFFLYIKYHYGKLDTLQDLQNKLKCPICRYIISKNNIRQILIKYLFLLKRLHLKINIRKICIYFNYIDKLTDKLKKSYCKDTNEHEDDEYEDDEYDEEFLKKKINFRSRQIFKLILM